MSNAWIFGQNIGISNSVYSSANFLIYYFFGTKFRRAFVVTYSPIWTYIKNKITRNKPPIIEEDCGFQVTAEVPENIELTHFNFKDFRSKYGPTLVWITI